MIKLFESSLDDDFFFATDIDSRGFEKVAAVKDLPKEVDEAIQNLDKKPNHKYVLLSAMGDGETWGSNRNGDYFPNKALTGTQRKDEKGVKGGKPVPRFKTFENAHFFHHHKNKIERGDPHYGHVAKAIWNPKMRTVLLIVGVDAKKDPETAADIESGKITSFSMGARLPYDICSKCGNKRTKLTENCKCLREGLLNKIASDGSKVYLINEEPDFFDISKVYKPAFEGGRSLMKVAADLGGCISSLDIAQEYGLVDDSITDIFGEPFVKYADLHTQILERIHKLPDHLVDTVREVCKTEERLPAVFLNSLAQFDMPDIWGAFAGTDVGIIPTADEFAYIYLIKQARYDLAMQYLGKDIELVEGVEPESISPELLGQIKVVMSSKSSDIEKRITNEIRRDRGLSTLDQRVYDTKRGIRKLKYRQLAKLGPLMSTLYFELRKNMEDAIKSIKTPPGMNKEAGTLVRAGLGFVTPYVASAHFQQKQMNGQPVGFLGRTVANNPAKIGIATALAVSHPAEMAETVGKTIRAFRK
jgi:hypothetical protein